MTLARRRRATARRGITTRLRRLLWAGPVLLAAACASVPVEAPETSGYDAERCLPDAGGSGRLPPEWSGRRRMVHAAVCEWSKFGFPTVAVRRASDARADGLPAELGLPGALAQAAPRRTARPEGAATAAEVQVRFGLTESELAVWPRVMAYWRATSPAYAGAVEAARLANPRFRPGWWAAWSAAFIGWVVEQAGVDWITPDDNHSIYLAGVLDRRPEAVVPVERFRPLPGDLVCFARLRPTEGENPLATSAGFLERLRTGPRFPAHCDVVVRRDARSLVAIGGNVKDAVAASVVPLDGTGRLVRTTARPWAVGVSLGEPDDPCARIEAVPLRMWLTLEAAEARRRALGRSC